MSDPDVMYGQIAALTVAVSILLDDSARARIRGILDPATQGQLEKFDNVLTTDLTPRLVTLASRVQPV